MLNNSFAILGLVQIVTSNLVSYGEMQITGVQEGSIFNPDALSIADPAKAAITLDGQTINVFGPNGATTEFSVHDGNFYQNGSDKPWDFKKLHGAKFEIKPPCRIDNCA